MKYGYARVSTDEQDLAVQLEALEAAGCDQIRSEKRSATTLTGRTELQTLLDFIREGDVLMCTKIDRIARSVADLQSIVAGLRSKGVRLQVLDQPIDTDSAAGKCFLDMLGVFAEFENSLRRERQMAGIRKAQQEGRYSGRPRKIDGDEVQRLKASGLGATEIAEKLGISRPSVYRYLPQK